MTWGRFQYTAGNNLAGTDGNPLAETVKQIYEQSVGMVVWNDQPPLGTRKPPGQKDPHAHSKGGLVPGHPMELKCHVSSTSSCTPCNSMF